jgi:PKHD-type hydroxylase
MANDTWQLQTHTVNTYCYYSGVFDDEMLDDIVTLGDSLLLKNAEVGGNFDVPGGENADIRKTTIGWIPTNDQNAWLYRKLTDSIFQANSKWFNYDLNHIESLQFSVYNEGDFYDAHVDHHYQGAGQYPRKLSFTMQLSDPSDYEGGDVNLITSQTPFAIPKERGTITFFPSYTLHEVKPVTKGIRKALVGWIHGPNWK